MFEDMQFRWHSIDDATREFIEQWRDLGYAASSTNIYLMPEFMLPAIRHLQANNSPKLAVVWNSDQSAMLAFCAFDTVPVSYRFPFVCLSAVKSKHSFQTGILLRAGSEHEALDCLFDNLLDGNCRALAFSELREESLLHQQLQDAAYRRGLRWFIHNRYQRASLKIGDCARWRNFISGSRHKKLQNARARLGKLGEVDMRIAFGNEISDTTVERFLRLESLGWKAESSLRSTQEGYAFYKEMTDACRSQGMLFFCELLLNEKAIASTANFYVNDVGFAFKTGMDPSYAKYSPGFLVEYGFLEACDNNNFPFREIESGAQADSYIEVLWPERVTMVNGQFVAGALPGAYSALKQAIKRLRQYLTTGQTPTR